MKITKQLKRFACWIGWHSFEYEMVKVETDDPLHAGICNQYKCKWCGYTGMVDCQGHLY